MSPPLSPPRPKRRDAAVLALIVGVVLVNVALRYQPYTFIRRDGSFYATISMGLVKGFSLDQRLFQPRSWYSGDHPAYANLDAAWSDVSVGRHGVWYPKHSFLISVAAAPLFALCGVIGFLVFNALCVVAMLWAAYLIAVRYASALAAAAAVLLTATSPMLIEHTYDLSADVFNAALIALGILALLWRRPVGAGTLLGLALWARPVTAVLVVPVTAALVWRRFDGRQLVRLGAATLVPLAAAALSNTIMFGAPWITSYDRVLVVKDRVPGLASHRELYTNSLLDGARLMFESRQHGLVANALPSLIALGGLVPLYRRQRALAVGLALAMAGFVASYVYYRYFNARFFFAWELLLCTPLAVLIGDSIALGRRAAGALRAPAEATGRRLRSVPRWALAILALLAAGGAGVARAVGQRTYVLSAHVTDAKVTRNDFPCDYFNITHQAWECSRLDRSEQELAGLAVGQRVCRFDGAAWDALTMAPPHEGGARRMRFEDLPLGPLELEYGARDGGPSRPSCLTASYGGRPAERLCAGGPGPPQRRWFEAPAPGQPRALEITIDGRGPRELCFDGQIRAGGAAR
jgi:hypothetical protein